MSQQKRMSRLTRRDFLRATAGFAGVAALAACATPGGAPAADDGSASGAPVEITFMGWGNPGEDEGVRNAIDVFQQENGGIQVTWLHTPENYAEKFLSNVAAGTPPDTAFVGSDVYGTYVHDDLLLDITDFLEADPLLGAEDYFIQPQERDRCTFEGRWYGIGSCWVAPHIYYNAATFEEAGVTPPSNNPDEAWTWDEFVEAARALTVDANGNHPGDADFDVDNVQRWGVHWSLPAGAAGATQLIAAIESNGNPFLNKETLQLTLNEPNAAEAVQNLADLMLVHQVMPQSTAMESLGMTNTQMLDTGMLGMAIDGSWALDWMSEIASPLGTGVLPKMGSQATNMQAHIHSALAASENPEAAWEWVRFLSTPFYQLQFCRTGLWLPSQTALATDEGLNEWITDGVHPEGYSMMVTDYLPRFGEAVYLPAGWPQANSILAPALDAVWVGDMTAADAFDQTVAEANEILLQAAES